MRSRKNLVLVGGGHSHLFVLEKLIKLKSFEFDFTLISPYEHQVYSGMVPGMIAGQYDPEDIQIHLSSMAEKAGGRFMRARAIKVDPQGSILCHSGEDIKFDCISFNIGSRARGCEVANEGPDVISVKPIQNVLGIAEQITSTASRPSSNPLRIVIIGAGAAGIELALAFQKMLGEEEGVSDIKILDSGDRIIRSHSRRVRRIMGKILQERGISVLLHHAVIGISDGMILASARHGVPYDFAVWTSGAGAPPIFRGSGLATDSDGFLQVNDFLQSVSHSAVFGGGDCISMQKAPKLPKSGVYAVREGPILANNLLAFLREKSLQPYRYQRRFLSILNTADGKALSNCVGFHSQLEMRLKDWIDRRFVTRFRQYT